MHLFHGSGARTLIQLGNSSDKSIDGRHCPRKRFVVRYLSQTMPGKVHRVVEVIAISVGDPIDFGGLMQGFDNLL